MAKIKNSRNIKNNNKIDISNNNKNNEILDNI